MKSTVIFFMGAAALVSMASCDRSAAESDSGVSQYVEPRIGTAHCRWFHFAPGAMPFGLAKPGRRPAVISAITAAGKQPDMITATA